MYISICIYPEREIHIRSTCPFLPIRVNARTPSLLFPLPLSCLSLSLSLSLSISLSVLSPFFASLYADIQRHVWYIMRIYHALWYMHRYTYIYTKALVRSSSGLGLWNFCGLSLSQKRTTIAQSTRGRTKTFENARRRSETSKTLEDDCAQASPEPLCARNNCSQCARGRCCAQKRCSQCARSSCGAQKCFSQCALGHCGARKRWSQCIQSYCDPRKWYFHCARSHLGARKSCCQADAPSALGAAPVWGSNTLPPVRLKPLWCSKMLLPVRSELLRRSKMLLPVRSEPLWRSKTVPSALPATAALNNAVASALGATVAIEKAEPLPGAPGAFKVGLWGWKIVPRRPLSVRSCSQASWPFKTAPRRPLSGF